MATRRDPRFKECRRFGVNVYGHPKALKRVRKDQRQKKCLNMAHSYWKNRNFAHTTICSNVSLSVIMIKPRRWKALLARTC